MDFLNLSGYCIAIHIQCRIQQLLRLLLKQQHLIPMLAFHRKCQFLPDFLIRNERCFSVLVISQVAKMDHICQNIIFALDINGIVLEGSRVYFNFPTGKHFNDCRFQPIIVHVDKGNDCFIGSRFRPVALKLSLQHNADNSSGIINLVIPQQVTIVPLFYLVKVFVVLLAKILNFFFRKANERCQRAGTDHGKLIEVIQGRLRFFLFDWQNAGEVCKLNVFCRLCTFE